MQSGKNTDHYRTRTQAHTCVAAAFRRRINSKRRKKARPRQHDNDAEDISAYYSGTRKPGHRPCYAFTIGTQLIKLNLRGRGITCRTRSVRLCHSPSLFHRLRLRMRDGRLQSLLPADRSLLYIGTSAGNSFSRYPSVSSASLYICTDRIRCKNNPSDRPACLPVHQDMNLYRKPVQYLNTYSICSCCVLKCQ